MGLSNVHHINLCNSSRFLLYLVLQVHVGAQRLIPAVYVLSTHKRKEAYGRVLLVVHQKITLLRGVGPVFAFPFRTERFKGDFEASFMIALRESLFTTDSNVTFSGCLFHFSQSSYRRIVELGLKVRISLKFL